MRVLDGLGDSNLNILEMNSDFKVENSTRSQAQGNASKIDSIDERCQ